MSRFIAFAYGAASYGLFFLTFLYTIGFVTNLVVPKTIESGEVGSLGLALLVDLGLIALFAVQHSVMARPGFKRVWTRIVPRSIERSTYVLISTLLLIALFAFWQPIPATLWSFDHPVLYWSLTALSLVGFSIILLASFSIDHFDLFGLRQVFLNLRRRAYTDHPFKEPGMYKLVRHPLYLGWTIAFWATPTMSVGHLLLAATLTVYMLIAIAFEERDLVAHFGDLYRRYRERTPMMFPRVGRERTVREAA